MYKTSFSRPQVIQIGAFDKAVNKNASLPPARTQSADLADAKILQQFNQLKFESKSCLFLLTWTLFSSSYMSRVMRKYIKDESVYVQTY